MKIWQHIPSYADRVKPEIFEGDFEDILRLHWVKAWKEQRGFFKFSIHYSHDGLYHLMAEYDEGRGWWVVGTLDEYVPSLPFWEANRKIQDGPVP